MRVVVVTKLWLYTIHQSIFIFPPQVSPGQVSRPSTARCSCSDEGCGPGKLVNWVNSILRYWDTAPSSTLHTTAPNLSNRTLQPCTLLLQLSQMYSEGKSVRLWQTEALPPGTLISVQPGSSWHSAVKSSHSAFCSGFLELIETVLKIVVVLGYRTITKRPFGSWDGCKAAWSRVITEYTYNSLSAVNNSLACDKGTFRTSSFMLVFTCKLPSALHSLSE